MIVYGNLGGWTIERRMERLRKAIEEALADLAIDTSDIPEVPEEWFKRARLVKPKEAKQ